MSDQTEERKFLHDISSPVAAGLFMMEGRLERMSQAPNVDPQMLEQIERVFKTFDKLRQMIHDRRAALIQDAKKEHVA
jgi:hypothetical protein